LEITKLDIGVFEIKYNTVHLDVVFHRFGEFRSSAVVRLFGNRE